MSYRVNCDQCQALVINNHPSHEMGCPNRLKKWEYDKDLMEIRPSDRPDPDTYDHEEDFRESCPWTE